MAPTRSSYSPEPRRSGRTARSRRGVERAATDRARQQQFAALPPLVATRSAKGRGAGTCKSDMVGVEYSAVASLCVYAGNFSAVTGVAGPEHHLTALTRSRFRFRQLTQVEVVHRYSKPDLTGVGLDRLAATLAAQLGDRRSDIRRQPRRFKLDQRLDVSLPAQVVADYKAGVTTTQLTGKYGLSKASVLRLLHDAGAEMRRQPFLDQEVDEAARLYASGLSVAAIGLRLGAHPSKVWRALRARGVTLRPPRNRPAT